MTPDKANTHQSRDAAEIAATISGEQFDAWYSERQAVENIRNGQPYFNGPGRVGPASRHSPSQLLQCHRKSYYAHHNTPTETSGDAAGIFWFGTKFEEEIAVPFLQNVVAGDTGRVVRNSMWIDTEVETTGGSAVIRGETDPVFVDRDSDPVLLTEIKTKESVEQMSEPNRHHLAQTHAYMYGLSEKHETHLTDAVVMYGGRKSLNVKAFHVEFDPWFWRETVLAWVGTQTAARTDKELPSASPEFDWECSFCDYRHRCGQGDFVGSDSGADGFIPLFVYPRESVMEYLQQRDAEVLTPTLAWHYRDLAERWDVAEWRCVACSERCSWQSVDWGGNVDSPPRCDVCVEATGGAELRGPFPEEQEVVE